MLRRNDARNKMYSSLPGNADESHSIAIQKDRAVRKIEKQKNKIKIGKTKCLARFYRRFIYIKTM